MCNPELKATVHPSLMEFRNQSYNTEYYTIVNPVVKGNSACGLLVTAESTMNTCNFPLLETLLIYFIYLFIYYVIKLV